MAVASARAEGQRVSASGSSARRQISSSTAGMSRVGATTLGRRATGGATSGSDGGGYGPDVLTLQARNPDPCADAWRMAAVLYCDRAFRAADAGFTGVGNQQQPCG